MIFVYADYHSDIRRLARKAKAILRKRRMPLWEAAQLVALGSPWCGPDLERLVSVLRFTSYDWRRIPPSGEDTSFEWVQALAYACVWNDVLTALEETLA